MTAVHSREAMLALVQPGDRSQARHRRAVQTSFTGRASKKRAWAILRRLKGAGYAKLRLLQARPYKAGELRIRVGDEVRSLPRDDCNRVVFNVALSVLRAGGSPEDALAVAVATCHWQDRAQRGKAEDPDRFIANVMDAYESGVESPDRDLESGEAQSVNSNTDSGALVLKDAANLLASEPPPREFLWEGWLPMGKPAVLFGDGGVGKTTLALQLAGAVATGRDFFGRKIKQGNVVMLLSENNEDDSARSLHAISRGYGLAPKDLKGKVLIASRDGLDNLLWRFGSERSGSATELFQQLRTAVCDIRPALIVLDAAVDHSDLDEANRFQVTEFISKVLIQLTRDTGACVLLLAHPSISGMTSGRGTTGSTAWHNRVRARLWLRRDLKRDRWGRESESDSRARILDAMKMQYGEDGNSVRMQMVDGYLIADDHSRRRPLTDKHRATIKEVERAFDAGEPWGVTPQTPAYRQLTNWMMRNLKLREPRARAIVDELLVAGHIVNTVADRNSKLKGACTPEQAAEQRDKIQKKSKRVKR